MTEDGYDDIVVHLTRPEDLVVVDPAALLDDPGPDLARTLPGVEEILAELLARPRLRTRRRIVLTVPSAGSPDAPDDTAPDDPAPDDTALAVRLSAVVARWCRSRMESAERASRGAWRQGVSSLGTGSLLFVIGLLLSTNFLEPDVPEFLQNLLGNGVFLVIAWIGLWYPLDLLFFARSPLRREMRALERMSQMPLVVRRRPAPTSEKPGA
jgi:hypothetical protein